MKDKKEKGFWNPTFTVFIIIICILIIYRNVFVLKSFELFFWFCDFSPFLILLAIILKNKDAINGLINFGLPIQVVYLIINFIKLFVGETDSTPLISPPNLNPWNLNIASIPAESIFAQNIFLIFIALIIHFVFIVAFIFFYNEKSNRKSIIYSSILTLMMFSIGFILPWEKNINQVFSLYGLEKIIPGYTQLWPIWIFLTIILPTYKIRNKIAKQF